MGNSLHRWHWAAGQSFLCGSSRQDRPSWLPASARELSSGLASLRPVALSSPQASATSSHLCGRDPQRVQLPVPLSTTLSFQSFPLPSDWVMCLPVIWVVEYPAFWCVLKKGGSSHITAAAHIDLRSHCHYKPNLMLPFPSSSQFSPTDRIRYKLLSMAHKASYSCPYPRLCALHPHLLASSCRLHQPHHSPSWVLGSSRLHTPYIHWFLLSSLQGVLLHPLRLTNCI